MKTITFITSPRKPGLFTRCFSDIARIRFWSSHIGFRSTYRRELYRLKDYLFLVLLKLTAASRFDRFYAKATLRTRAIRAAYTPLPASREKLGSSARERAVAAWSDPKKLYEADRMIKCVTDGILYTPPSTKTKGK